jgi:hypothetical protein
VAAGGTLGTGGNASGGITSGGTANLAGGTASTGGTTSTTLIDDFEDGNGELPKIGGRVGYWYTSNDSTLTGTQLPVYGSIIFAAQPIIDRPGSNYAIWTEGSGFTAWGAGLGAYLNTNASQGRFYDASAYRGITFWAKAEDGRANVIRFNVSNVATVADGNICTGNGCWDHFGAWITLGTTWRRYSFLFSDLTQRGWAVPLQSQLDITKLRGLEFTVQAGVDFGFYVDDVAFIQ